MYKIYFFLFSLLAFVNSLYSQIDTINVSDGIVTKVIVIEDNPGVVPKWELNIQPIALKVSPTDFFGFHLAPRYRFTERITVSMPVTVSYGKGKAINTPEYLRTRAVDIRMIGHLSLKNAQKQKIKQLNIRSDFKWENADLKKLKTVFADFGLGYNRTGSAFFLNNTSPSSPYLPGLKWRGDAMDNLEVIFGISSENSSSTYLEVEGIAYYQYKIKRFYANLSFSFVNKYDIYGVDFYNDINDPSDYWSPATYELVPKNESSKILVSVPIGFRMGYTYNKNIKNSPLSFTFGCEIGKFPGYKQKGINIKSWLVHFNSGKHSNPAYFLLRFGFSFGAKTKFSEKTKKSIIMAT